MPYFFNKYQNTLLCLIAGIAGLLVPFSLAPYNFSVLAFISCLLLIAALQNASPKQAILRGYIYGVVMFGYGVSWLYISVHEHGNASPLLAFSLTSLLICGILALYPAFKCWLYQYLNKKLQANKLVLILCLPSIWVIGDWLQGWLFTGFPWLYIGYSQTNSLLSGYAPVVSVYGVTWLIVFISALLYLSLKNIVQFIDNNNNQYTLNNCLNYMVIITVIFISSYSLKNTSWTNPSPDSEQVVLVQGNIAQSNRWQPDAYKNNIATYEELTKPYWQHSTIIWPESSISIPLPYSNNLISNWQQQAIENNSTLILGIPSLANEHKQYFNSIIAIGTGEGVHNKNKLVPWGEYVPLENIFRGLIQFFDLPMSNFISGAVNSPHFNILNSEAIKWLPFICYEIAYPNYVINHASLGDAIVTISNDAWFGDSIGPWQHLQLAQMRALETARPVIRSTNNGVTAIIAPNGKLLKQIEQFKPGVLVDTVKGYTGTTPIMYLGINFIILLNFMMVAIVVVLCCNKTKSTLQL